MPRHASETALAIYTLCGTSLHLVLETYYHLVWGQPAQALIVDYISVALCLFGGITSLRVRPRSAAGLLAAAWAFNLGFGWRSVFGRLERRAADVAAANREPDYVVTILIIALSSVAVALIWSLWLAYRQAVLGPTARGSAPATEQPQDP